MRGVKTRFEPVEKPSWHQLAEQKFDPGYQNGKPVEGQVMPLVVVQRITDHLLRPWPSRIDDRPE